MLTLVGRLKELINRAGEKISPVEIDEALLSHPAVSEAVAFAIPDPRYGEQPAAAVVLSAEVTERELTDHCRTSLADFKCPRVIHIVGRDSPDRYRQGAAPHRGRVFRGRVSAEGAETARDRREVSLLILCLNNLRALCAKRTP